MKHFETEPYKVFELFKKQWGLVTTGEIEHFNSCTISWGSMGTLWTRPNKDGSIITVYLHPNRYTQELLLKNDFFTVSFFPQEYRESLTYMGRHSGRDQNKAVAAGLTPIEIAEGITYKEANLTFLCKKIYQHQFSKEDLAADVQEYYKNNVRSFPTDQNGNWQPHWMFIGEIIKVYDECNLSNE